METVNLETDVEIALTLVKHILTDGPHFNRAVPRCPPHDVSMSHGYKQGYQSDETFDNDAESTSGEQFALLENLFVIFVCFRILFLVRAQKSTRLPR